MMKQKQILTLLALLTWSASLRPTASLAAPAPAAPTDTLQDMRDNAQAVQQDAFNYQWRRVNREVTRIVADEKVLEQQRPAEASRRSIADHLRQAVLDLRSAQFNRDADKSVAAARRIADDCDQLLH